MSGPVSYGFIRSGIEKINLFLKIFLRVDLKIVVWEILRRKCRKVQRGKLNL